MEFQRIIYDLLCHDRNKNGRGAACYIRRDIGYIQNMTVIHKIAPFKNKRVKRNVQKLFDGEVLEKLNSKYKPLHKFKKSRIHIDKEKSWIWNLETGCQQKAGFFQRKIPESIGKLWIMGIT